MTSLRSFLFLSSTERTKYADNNFDCQLEILDINLNKTVTEIYNLLKLNYIDYTSSHQNLRLYFLIVLRRNWRDQIQIQKIIIHLECRNRTHVEKGRI